MKEINELLDGVELLVVSGKKIAKDGISLADLPEAVELVKHVDVIIAAAEGANKALGEAKEASEEELLALGLRVIKLVKAIKVA